MKQKTWIVVILLGTVAVNAVAYVVVRGRRAAEAPPAPAAVAAPPAAQQAVASVTPPPPPPQPPQEDANEGIARARRASGLAALEDRDYETAVAEFTEALRLRKDDKGDLVELLRIAMDLRTREQERKQRAERPRPSRDSSGTSRTASKSRTTRVASRAQARDKDKEKANEESTEEESRGALLLVTSTPPGLTVLVDGKAMDLTPARMPMRVGTYRVAIAQGERRLAEETVTLEEDDVHSINRDVSAELAPPPSRPAPTPVAAALPAPTTPAANVATPPPAPRPEPVATAVAPAAVAQKGDLDVTSPSLYGEVWINNRPYGFPPIKALGLPAGTARVEVRVNGVVKRKMNVEVEPGRLTAVRVR